MYGSQILAAGLGNAAMLYYLDVTAEISAPRSAALGSDLVQLPTESMERSLVLLKKSVILDPDNVFLHWGLMRVSLMTGNVPSVTLSVDKLLPDIRSNPWLYQDLLLSYSYAGDQDRVVALFEAVAPPQKTDVIRDVVALAYLEVDREGSLDKADQLRPGDLFVNYSLWQVARKSGNVGLADFYRQQLERFPLSGVSPTDSRLLTYATSVIPEIFTEGIWDKEQTLNIVALLVWQNYSFPTTLQLTERLGDVFPLDPDWLFYRAEIYHRRGNFNQAAYLYRQVISLDPAYASAYLQLGTVIESQIDARREVTLLREVRTIYQHYYALKGDDLLGWKKLNEICTELSSYGDDEQICRDTLEMELVASKLGALDGQPGSEPLELVMHRYDDLRPLVATLLNLSEGQLELGPNLIENGGFEDWLDQGLPGMNGVRKRPRWWSWVEMYGRDPFNPALFIGSPDDLVTIEGNSVARIDGQWIAHETDRAAARAGFWQLDEQTRGLSQIELSAGTAYLLTFVYRTQRVADGKTTVWVASADEPASLWSGSDPLLPATGGAWYRFVAIGWNDTLSTGVVRPLLRLYSTGSVSFDDVVLKPIYFTDKKPDNTEVQVHIVRGRREYE